jgi:hypothetical protein
MPPKKSKSTNKDDERATEKKVTSVPKLTQKTLTSDKLIDDPAPKAKSKKFVVGAATTKSSSHRWKLGDGKTPNKLTISSWNVNGIRSVLKKSELQNYVASKKPDMICINETKIDEKAYDK